MYRKAPGFDVICLRQEGRATDTVPLSALWYDQALTSRLS
jgi:hypothetical protein